MNLKTIFESITPENIKSIPLLKTAMDIFIQNLEENSKISTDIKQIYNNISKETDSDILQESKDKLRKGLLDVYLSSFFNVLSKAQNNDIVKAKLSSVGLTDIPFINDVNKILNDEYFITNKTFKEKLGTELGIKYAYNLTKYLETSTGTNNLTLYEEKPFHFRTEGSIYKEMYENIVKPLSHPLGFTYTYNQILTDTIQDIFGVSFIYTIYNIELRNIEGLFEVFTSAEDDSLIKADFLTRINPATLNLFTETEYNDQVIVYTNKIVDTFTDIIIDDRIFRSLLFTDGTYLEQYSNPIEILYINYDDFISNIDNPIKEYSGHWSLYVNYTSDYEFSYKDEITNVYQEFNITKIKEDNNGLEDQKYYNFTSPEYTFHVGGDIYSFAPGQDESKTSYENYDLINDEISNKFNVEISGKSLINNNITIILSDMFGYKITKENILCDGGGNFSATFNTYELGGNEYKITASVTNNNIVNTYELSTTGLNNFTNEFGFNSVQDNSDISKNTIRANGFGEIGKTVYITLTDSVGNTFSDNVIVDSLGIWEIDLPYTTLTAGNYRIDAVIYETNGKPKYTSFFTGTNLRTLIDDTIITVNIFSYENGAPNFINYLNYTQLSSIEDMAGFSSTDQYILKQIGELAIDDTYAQPDIDLLTYMVNNNISSINALPEDIFLQGSYIEGSDYTKSFQSLLPLQETFINYGRRIYPIDTSDFIVMTSTDYCLDTVLMFNLSTSGYYLYTDEINNIDFYMNTSDDFYLTTLGDEI